MGFHSQAMRKCAAKNASAIVESAPTSQSLAERTYNRIGTSAKVMRPQAANHVKTSVLGSLMTLGPRLSPIRLAPGGIGTTIWMPLTF